MMSKHPAGCVLLLGASNEENLAGNSCGVAAFPSPVQAAERPKSVLQTQSFASISAADQSKCLPGRDPPTTPAFKWIDVLSTVDTHALSVHLRD